MKYIIGDKVKIVKDEYRWNVLRTLIPLDWVVTISNVIENRDYDYVCYMMKEIPCRWLPQQIEGYGDFINDRSEILDL